ncbi:MAG: hypothetical protein AAF498_02945 [Pseudomonadota bacterium]
MTDYSYLPKKKRAIPLLGLAAVSLLAMTALSYGAPSWIWIIATPIGITLLFLLTGKQRFGMRIEGDQITIGVDPIRRRLKLADVEILVISRLDDRLRYEFKMKNGSSQYVLPQNMPPPRAIAGQLELRGIRTEIKESAI